MGVAGGPSIPQSGMQLNLDASIARVLPVAEPLGLMSAEMAETLLGHLHPHTIQDLLLVDINNRIQLTLLCVVALLLIHSG